MTDPIADLPASPVQPDWLQQGVDQGCLRPLDRALALQIRQWQQQLQPATDAPTLEGLTVLTALLAQLDSRGHTCLPLSLLSHDALALMNWPAESQTWWRARPGLDPSAADLALMAVTAQPDAPLVVADNRVYLRRHWVAERTVAREVLRRAADLRAVDEAGVAQALAQLFPPSDTETLPPSDLSPELPTDPPPDWQAVACAVAVRAGLSIITGGPGTGKTYTVARLLDLMHRLAPAAADKPRIRLAAPTGKAAARLRQSIDQALGQLSPGLRDWIDDASTLHALLGVQPGTRRFRHDAAHPLEVDVLIVDEASMVHLEMMASLLEALPAHARLVLLGDKDQLASVEAGAVLGDLCRRAEDGLYDDDTLGYLRRVLPRAPDARWSLAEARRRDLPSAGPTEGGLTAATAATTAIGPGMVRLARQTVMLRVSRRFDGPIGQLALAVNQGRAAAARQALAASPEVRARVPARPDDVVRLALAEDAAIASARPYLSALSEAPAVHDAGHPAWVRRVLLAFDRFRVLCATRDGAWGVAGVNDLLETAFVRAGLLRKDGPWYEGRPVMVTRNDPVLGVFNGDVGVALRAPSASGGQTLRVWFLDGPELRSVQASRLSEVETAFAMTVHKSQGSEFEHTVLMLPDRAGDLLTRELVYTGITRARQAFTLLAPQWQVFDAALGRRTRRHTGLPDTLDALSDSV